MARRRSLGGRSSLFRRTSPRAALMRLASGSGQRKGRSKKKHSTSKTSSAGTWG